MINSTDTDTDTHLFGEELSGSTNAVPGLWELPSLTPEECAEIVEIVERENWFHSGLNQKIAFGRMQISSRLLEIITKHLGSNSICDKRSQMFDRIRRGCWFDQMIANSYAEGDYVKDHIDLHRFDDGILIINLYG